MSWIHIVLFSDLGESRVQSEVETKLTNQEIKDSGWRFNKVTSISIWFFRTKELSGSSYVKINLWTAGRVGVL